MKNIFFIISIVALLFGSQKAKAQLPVNDIGWILQDGTGGTLNLSDEFNGSSLDGTKWYASDSFPIESDAIMAFNRPNHNNITFSSGKVSLKADTLYPARTHTISTSSGTVTLTCHYQGSLFQSNNFSFKYGYLEMYAKLPTKNMACWPAFWTWDDSCSTNPKWYNEMDLLENGPDDSQYDGHWGSNVAWNDTGCNIHIAQTLPHSITGLPKLDTSFHKYGVLWDKQNITWYFDDAEVRHIYNPTQDTIPQHFQALIFDFSVPTWEPANTLPHLPPSYFTIDYFHYYKLIGHCQSAKTICSPISYDRGVYQTINTGGGGCGTAPTFNTSSQYTLRATDSVILDAGTTINADGSGQFTVLIVPCPN